MSHTRRGDACPGTPVSERGTAWIGIARAPAGDRYVSQVRREVECLRAACASAGLLRRWWLRRRLRALEKQKAALEQPWQRLR